MLLEEAIEKWLKSKEITVSKETLRTHRVTMNYLNKYLEKKYNSMIYLEEIRTEDIESFFRYLKIERGNQINSIKTHRRKINTFYNYLKKRELVKENIVDPIPKIKIKERPRTYLTKEEIEEIIKELKTDVLRTYFLTLYYTGLRRQEALGMMLDDINLDKGEITVKNGKGGKSRIIPISNKLKEILENYIINIRPEVESKRVFASKRTGKLDVRYIENALRKALVILGWQSKGITIHSFRHSFAGKLIKEKVNLKVIQKLLGHTDISVTAIYLRADTEDMRKAVEEL